MLTRHRCRKENVVLILCKKHLPQRLAGLSFHYLLFCINDESLGMQRKKIVAKNFLLR
jgi:hypothetical protein